MHLFLSPHADDAPLSCGGQIALLTRQGQRVAILTVMAADAPATVLTSPFVHELHARWGLGEAAPAGRRAEDAAAAAVLGAEMHYGPYPDAIYRLDAQGQPMYHSRNAIFGMVHLDDPVREARRAATVQALLAPFALTADDTVHIPLGVGRHVDHQLVRDMGKAILQWHPLPKLSFYEDYPYVLQGEAQVGYAVAALGLDLARRVYPLDAGAIEAKIASVGCYQSQLSSFWQHQEHMADELCRDAETRGGEGEWLISRAFTRVIAEDGAESE